MKYIKKFNESEMLDFNLVNCFEGVKDIINRGKRITIQENKFFRFSKQGITKLSIGKDDGISIQMNKDLIDEIISSIGKAGEIGHKFFKLIILSTSGHDETYNNVDDIPNSLSYIKFADQIDVYFD